MRKLRGRAHRKKVPASAKPAVTPGVPTMPAHLKSDRIAAATWTRLCKQLTKMRVLSAQDGVALEGLCVAYSRAVAADTLVARDGLVVITKRRGATAHPAVRMSVQAWAEVRRFAQEFGLTPSAATRVRTVPATDEEPEPEANADAFLFRKNRSGVVGHVGEPRTTD
jgi:P27 family predicted phage terminase small subunit